MEDEIHKCPLCNAEITIEKLKEAIKKRKEDRRSQRQLKMSQLSKVLPSSDDNFEKRTKSQVIVPNINQVAASNNSISINSNVRLNMQGPSEEFGGSLGGISG